MDKYVKEKLQDLMASESFVGMRLAGHNTWEITINQDSQGNADYQNSNTKELDSLKQTIAEKIAGQARMVDEIAELKRFQERIKTHWPLLRVLLEDEIDRNCGDYPKISQECRKILELVNREFLK